MKERIVNNGETGETGENEDPNYGNEYLATDEDFTWMLSKWEGYEAINEEGNGFYQYTGSETTVRIPHEIYGHPMTSYYRMFDGTSVTKVISDNSNVTNMSFMFDGSKAISLDLSSFDTPKVTSMSGMFYGSQATSLDLSSFDTSKVTSMSSMFEGSKATELDLSSFDTSDVTHMNYMFEGSQATSLDLSNFDTSNVKYMDSMFNGSQATTGYARTVTDADRFNASSDKPSVLTFVVK